MTESTAACRLHVLLAKDADVGIVFRRGPSAWWHILRWDLAKFTLESGSWLKGTLYPTKLILNRYSEFGSCLHSIMYPDNQENFLPDAVWADFDRRGRLAVASATGELKLYEIENSSMTTVFSSNLNSLKPDPVRAPAWARKW